MTGTWQGRPSPLPTIDRLAAEPPISFATGSSVHDHWRLFFVEGIVLNVLGLAAIIVPNIAGLVATVCLGWLFLVAGVVGLVFTLRARQAPGFGWALLSALLAVVAGGFLLWSPLEGLATLTYVLTLFFIADGLLMIFLALAHRRALASKWGWMLVNGIVDLILAAVIISGLPGSLLWVFGLLVGIDLIFGGASLIGLAMAARKDHR